MKQAITALAVAGLATGALANEATPITAIGPDGDLAGTLTLAQAGHEEEQPVVLIIPGSGPTDRDGNNPMGVTAAPYRLLAEGLAQRGIGSVRIDKRGMFGSAGAVPDANDVTIADYADDVEAWVTATRSATMAQCIWIVGHSEGGLVALAAAQRQRRDICGIILIASVGRPIGTILREQLMANPANAPILNDALAAIDTLEAGERVDVSALHPALQGLFAPGVQGFLIDMMAYDPPALAATTALPMLIVAGGKDLQTPVADARAIVERQPGAKLVILPDMNHVLKTVEAEGRAANLATYANPSLPLAPGLIDAIADFVTKQEPFQ